MILHRMNLVGAADEAAACFGVGCNIFRRCKTRTARYAARGASKHATSKNGYGFKME
jgi:hypothetical protein